MGKVVQQASALKEAAARINAAFQAAEDTTRKGLTYYRDVGKLLTDVKKTMTHGTWLPWITKNCKFGPRQARTYMRIYEEWARLSRLTSLAEAVRMLGAENGDETEPGVNPNPPAETPSVFCRNCRIGGPKKGCPACAELQGKTTPKPAVISSNAIPVNRTMERCWYNWMSTFGSVVRVTDQIVKEQPAFKKLPEFKELDHLLEQAAKLAKKIADQAKGVK